MTNISTPPPPSGWYPAPDGSSSTWWWDGAAWVQPHDLPATQLRAQPATDTAIAKLATATQLLLIVCGGLSVATIGVEAFGMSAATGFLNGQYAGIEPLNAYDQLTLVATLLGGLSVAATGVLWVIWQYRVAKQLREGIRRSPGWHIGSWFVPVISLWFPYQNVSDLWRAVGRSRPSWLISWWLLWLVSSFFIQLSGRIYAAAEDLEQLRVAMLVSIVGEICSLVAVPLAWLTVRGITRGLLQRSSVKRS